MQRSIAIVMLALLMVPAAFADDWKTDPIWHDGLVEKAVYSASRLVYGKPRAYEAIFFTNKEQHDRRTLTKADKSTDTIEVWKLNQIEAIPTPNYTYHYVTTSHLAVNGMQLTRLDSSSQEFCGTSFKQYLQTAPNQWDYWSFSYLPEAGRQRANVDGNTHVIVPADALPLYLRGSSFTGVSDLNMIWILPSQKSNAASAHEPVAFEVRYVGDEGDSHKLELHAGDKLLGTWWMAKDRLHVMTKYVSGDGAQTYELKSIDRVDYWTRHE